MKTPTFSATWWPIPQTLSLDLHEILQKDLGYDPSQLASFFITNQQWEKQQEITLIDMMPDPGLSTSTMDQTTLGEHLHELNQRMIYVFDFFQTVLFSLNSSNPRMRPLPGIHPL
jgi:hypothetical protein